MIVFLLSALLVVAYFSYRLICGLFLYPINLVLKRSLNNPE